MQENLGLNLSPNSFDNIDVKKVPTPDGVLQYAIF